MDKLHSVTIRALRKRPLASRELGLILGCTEQNAEDLIAGRIVPSAREFAILRLCANVISKRLVSILKDLSHDYEWRTVPGHPRYEVSIFGQVRRAASGHGSLPGHVLAHRLDPKGYHRVNLSMNGKTTTIGVHRVVCLAWHGPPPSPSHQACHKNDRPGDNVPSNLYWGTPLENTRDRIRNAPAKIDTNLAQFRVRDAAFLSQKEIRKRQKFQMLKRLNRIQQSIEDPAPLGGEGCPARSSREI